jgi:hypothetical protein
MAIAMRRVPGRRVSAAAGEAASGGGGAEEGSASPSLGAGELDARASRLSPRPRRHTARRDPNGAGPVAGRITAIARPRSPGDSRIGNCAGEHPRGSGAAMRVSVDITIDTPADAV